MDALIRAAIDQHAISAKAWFYRSIEGAVFEQMPDWVRGVSGLDVPEFNIFMPLHNVGLNDDTLADTEAYFASYQSLYAVELIHDRFPQGPDYLTRLAYEPLPPQPAMYLPTLSEMPTPKVSCDIQRVQTVPTQTAFYTLVHNVFDYEWNDLLHVTPMSQLNAAYGFHIRHYVAFWDDTPVAAGTAICSDNVVSIRDLCTLDNYRRRGIATALLHRILKDADNDGFSLAMLYSTAQAYHLFANYGFEIYTQRQWFLPPGLLYMD